MSSSWAISSRSALRGGDVFSPAASDEGLSTVGGALTDARDEDNAGARMLARATRGNLVDGEVVLGPNREAVEEEKSDASEHEAVVLASGGLGLIYLTERSHRMTIGEIDRLHPRLISTLIGHPGIGFVMVRADDDGAIVLGPRGSRRLRDDAVSGEDPLRHFGRERRRSSPAHGRVSPLPGPPGQLHVRPGGKRGRPVRGVHGLPRRHRRLAEPSLRLGAERRGER